MSTLCTSVRVYEYSLCLFHTASLLHLSPSKPKASLVRADERKFWQAILTSDPRHRPSGNRPKLSGYLTQVPSSALSMSSWEQLTTGISSYTSKLFIDFISVCIPSMISCSVNSRCNPIEVRPVSVLQ